VAAVTAEDHAAAVPMEEALTVAGPIPPADITPAGRRFVP